MFYISEMIARMIEWTKEEKGQTLVEYGLILALISVVAITALALIGTNVTNIFNSIAGHL